MGDVLLGTSDYKFGDLTQKFVRDITGKRIMNSAT